MNQQKVLTAYKLPAFQDILNDSFLNAFGLNQARQYGIACKNVKAECVKAEALGTGPFLAAKIPAPNWVENGQRRRCKLDFAMGYTEDFQLEFLAPGTGTGFYADALGDSEYVLHHVGIFQNNSHELERHLNTAGFKTIVNGGVHLGKGFGFRFKYFDTQNEIGCYLELLDFYLLGRPIVIDKSVKVLAKLQQNILSIL